MPTQNAPFHYLPVLRKEVTLLTVQISTYYSSSRHFVKGKSKKITSFFAFVRASSSDDTGIALDDSDEYRFTTDILSITDEVLPHSPNIVSSFFRMNDGGAPKSGPKLETTKTRKKAPHD